MRKALAALVVASVAGVVALAAGLTYTAPAGWKSTPPRSSMRFAEFTLPREAGDAEDAQLVIYFFGKGEGGSVEDNIDRWISQVQQPGGKPSKPVAKRETRKINGLNVTLLDVTGTYNDGGMMMSGGAPPAPKPNFRMRAGVVETPGGNYFLKLTGPQKTVTNWDAAFSQFVGSLKYQP